MLMHKTTGASSVNNGAGARARARVDYCDLASHAENRLCTSTRNGNTSSVSRLVQESDYERRPEPTKQRHALAAVGHARAGPRGHGADADCGRAWNKSINLRSVKADSGPKLMPPRRGA
eukprot:3584594-Prymnesium_polylepis.1